MPTWKTRGLRGSGLEDMINLTNNVYREKALALIQKIPTPITPINIDKETRHITLAYFDQKSTVDYIGAVQGIPVCFDAKECKVKRFPLANIHEHQINFMKEFEGQEGIAFFLIYFTKEDRYYYLRFKEALVFWERMENGGPKSFEISELSEDYFFEAKNPSFIPYLEMVKKDIIDRNENNTV